MSETQMPVAETSIGMLENEKHAYELAFHVLPTVAEGEVKGVFDGIKALITKDHGEIFDEEAPERFELAYEIVKHLEGKNRKYTSAYFGWVRFRAESSVIEPLLEELSHNTNILRHLLIKLSRTEEENPFRFHEALESIESTKKIVTIDEADLVKEAAEDGESTEDVEEEAAEVAEEEIKNESEVK